MELIREQIEPMFGWEELPGANEFEIAVVYLRKKNRTYSEIQQWLGNPSKKTIREVLLKWNPNLINIETGQIKKKDLSNKPSKYEYILMNLLTNNLNKQFYVFCDSMSSKELWKFIICEKRLFYIESDGETYMFGDWDECTQNQILQEIKNQLNEEN